MNNKEVLHYDAFNLGYEDYPHDDLPATAFPLNVNCSVCLNRQYTDKGGGLTVRDVQSMSNKEWENWLSKYWFE